MSEPVQVIADALAAATPGASPDVVALRVMDRLREEFGGEVSGYRAIAEYFAQQLERSLRILERVRMDTPGDQRLHDEAVAAVRTALAAGRERLEAASRERLEAASHG